MAKCVNPKNSLSFPGIKSRNGKLSVNDKTILEQFINK